MPCVGRCAPSVRSVRHGEERENRSPEPKLRGELLGACPEPRRSRWLPKSPSEISLLGQGYIGSIRAGELASRPRVKSVLLKPIHIAVMPEQVRTPTINGQIAINGHKRPASGWGDWQKNVSTESPLVKTARPDLAVDRRSTPTLHPPNSRAV